ncbi:MAG TPA: PKD domain-containing protein [Solirubrobacteraceae bacterium]|jgi:hypothetical protein|nr:PKD domain-containing protein [Solirubrobacteraceae bacterium]
MRAAREPMRAGRSIGSLVSALVVLSAVMAIGAGACSALEPRPQIGALPGFPRERGVVPVLGSPAASSLREQQVKNAFKAARGAAQTLDPHPEGACSAEFQLTQNVCYHGGPVLRKPTVHLIFWLGPNTAGVPSTPNVSELPALYRSTIERYFSDVAHDSGGSSDVYAVDPQYFDTQGSGVNGSVFEAANSQIDSKPFPARTEKECPGFAATVAEGPCVLDSDIQKEVESEAKTSTAGLGNIYFVFTPKGVSSCASFGCSYSAYCAYHSDFGGDGLTPGPQTVYANMPFAAPGVCDVGAHPNEPTDEGTDAAIDVASHEFNEAVTDPIGSQCKSLAKGECEPLSWTDAIGQEIGDKCLPPETTLAGTYGSPLVENLGASSYNQEINGHRYLTQREWSNEAGLAEGGCVQRMIGSSFSVSAGAAATVPIAFDGAASGAPGDPAVYWVWNFEGEQVGTPSATTSHTYAAPGTHEVGLSAYDAYGNSEARVESVSVGTAPVPPPPPPPSSPPTPSAPLVVKEPAAPPAHFTLSQLAARLGLPANGRKLSGGGHIALGHGECPPACVVTLQLYAKVSTTTRGHRSTKLAPVGALRLTIAAKGTGTLSLSLNANGRAMLRKLHKLYCQLNVTVEGQEGGSWQIVRSLTLTR